MVIKSLNVFFSDLIHRKRIERMDGNFHHVVFQGEINCGPQQLKLGAV